MWASEIVLPAPAAGLAARGVAGLLIAGVWAACLYKRTGPAAAGTAILTAYLLVSPTVHPWYCLWLIPFALATGYRPGLLLSFTVFAAYAVLPGYITEGVWELPGWARAAVYGPPLAAVLWQWSRRRKLPLSQPAPVG